MVQGANLEPGRPDVDGGTHCRLECTVVRNFIASVGRQELTCTDGDRRCMRISGCVRAIVRAMMVTEACWCVIRRLSNGVTHGIVVDIARGDDNGNSNIEQAPNGVLHGENTGWANAA